LSAQGKPSHVVTPLRTSGTLPTATSREHPHDDAERFNHSARALEPPMRVKEAAKFLGVSPQTVYLWVERKQIPHLRVMGRNIRFLKSDLESFRASFRQEMVNV
jgi:excisionase family DNA binding protein